MASAGDSGLHASQQRGRKVHPFKRSRGKVVEYEGNPQDNEEEPETRALGRNELKRKASELLRVRQTFPVYQNREEIMKYIRENQVSILIGETGSGKSTQIPQFVLEDLYRAHSRGAVAVTQPRRVAAINLATRVAQEYGCNVGEQVGYSVRFDNTTGSKTRLKYVTDGMLLRELMMHRDLKEYSVIVIDEAHERTVLTDLILGFLKALIQGPRPDLKIIVMSATLQAEKFSGFFDNAPILFVEGRKFGVDQYYLGQACDDVVDSMVRCCCQINQGEQMGDVLCFLPGQEEIDKAVTILNKIAACVAETAAVPLMVALPLYAALPPAQQALVFSPVKGFKRKIVFSTNIAETSVTISGVKFVIDSGLRKVKVWRHQLGLATLLTVPISRASAMQRTGRAGRESEGKCYRLYRESDYEQLPLQTEPEIARSDVTAPVLMLKRYDVADVVNWTWFENPGRDALVQALQQLYELQALDDAGKITTRGRQMALLPLPPQMSSVLLQAQQSNCLAPVIAIVACLSVENFLLNPAPELRDDVNERRQALCSAGKRHGDLLMMKELFDIASQIHTSQERVEWCKQLCVSHRAFKNIVKIKEQLKSYCKQLFRDTAQEEEETLDDNTSIARVIKCFLSGFSKNTAIRMPDRSYRTVLTGEPISVHPSSLLFLNAHCPAILYTEYLFTTKGYARNVTRLELQWLQEVAGVGAGAAKQAVKQTV